MHVKAILEEAGTEHQVWLVHIWVSFRERNAGILAAEGKLDMNEVVAHFVHVNQCSYQEYKEHEGQAWKTWMERNKHGWTTDLGAYAHVVR